MEVAGPLNFAADLHWLDWSVVIGYLVIIVGLGIWFGKFTSTTSDFFLAGQRFSWWVGSLACVATLVGSYSFLQYSQNGYNFGLSAMTAYTNDWFVLPLFLFVWVPIVYYARLTSIPEYFERRFDRRTRIVVLLILLVYLQGYIGINLYTIGVAVHGLLGWNVTFSAAVLSVLTGVVIYAGGATSVMMADLLQAFLLLSAGLLVFALGLQHLGGIEAFWSGLTTTQKLPFAGFNSPPEFHFVGDFWGDAMTGTIAFYFINQSVLMRILAVKSVRDVRRTMLFTVVVLMPLAAVAVCGGGWIARAMVTNGQLAPAGDGGKDVFIDVARTVCPPGAFGFVMAAMLAALMSTLEALINAVSAVAINDIWRPIVRPGRDDAYYLRSARFVAVAANVVGIISIPLFSQFASIYQALAHFTAIVTPPLIVVICLGAVWRRFTPSAAFWTLILGTAALLVSLFVPQLITPLAHGEAIAPGSAPWEQHTYMRSLFGIVVCLVLGVVITLLTRPKPESDIRGLFMASIPDAMRIFKGGPPNLREPLGKIRLPWTFAELPAGTVSLPAAEMERLAAESGDLLYVSDDRWWLGGLRSVHVRAGASHSAGDVVQLSAADAERGNLIAGRQVRVEKTI